MIANVVSEKFTSDEINSKVWVIAQIFDFKLNLNDEIDVTHVFSLRFDIVILLICKLCFLFAHLDANEILLRFINNYHDSISIHFKYWN